MLVKTVCVGQEGVPQINRPQVISLHASRTLGLRNLRKTALFWTTSSTGTKRNLIDCKHFTYRQTTGQAHKTGINIAASLHFVAALPNTHYFEYCVEQGDLRRYLTRQAFPVTDGDIAVPEEPGLGIELNEEIVAKYRVR